MKKLNIYLILVIAILFVGCADHTAVVPIVEGAHVYGFWGGLWHGMIAPFDLIGMIFFDDVTVYAESNNGGWYAFGFCLGIGALSSSSTSASTRR